jgi:hypothetical protein
MCAPINANNVDPWLGGGEVAVDCHWNRDGSPRVRWKDAVWPKLEEPQGLWARSGAAEGRGMQAADSSEYKLPSTSTPVRTVVCHGCQSQLHLRHPCSGHLWHLCWKSLCCASLPTAKGAAGADYLTKYCVQIATDCEKSGTWERKKLQIWGGLCETCKMRAQLQKPSPEIIFTFSCSPHLLWKRSTRLWTDVIPESVSD